MSDSGPSTPSLPWSPEAEVGVLGSAFIDVDAIDTARATVRPDDFFRSAHRVLWRSVTELRDAGQPVDVVTLANRLQDDGTFEEAGGYDYLTELIDAVPTAVHVGHYAETVREKAQLRRLISACQDTMREAMELDGIGPAEVFESAERRILEASGQRIGGRGYRPIRDVVWDAMQLIEEEANTAGGVTGIPSGIPSLDRMTTGMQPGDLTVLAGRPSMGKTALALLIATYAAKSNAGVAVCSLEMTDAQLVKRAMAMRAGLDLMAIRRGELIDRDYRKLSDASGWLHNLPVHIDDHPGANMAELRVKVRRMAREGVQLLVVDYLQLMDGQGENRTQQVSSISRGLKQLARELDIHVLALSQLSRAVENRSPPRPQLSDLRDSGAIEQDADVVLMLWRPEYYFTERTPMEAEEKWQGKGELIVSKQRNGPTGSILLHWDAPTTRFTEYERAVTAA